MPMQNKLGYSLQVTVQFGNLEIYAITMRMLG